MNDKLIELSELRKHLSKYLGLVERGEVIIITRRGKILGRIISERKYLEDQMTVLVKSGVVRWGGKPLSPWEPTAINIGPDLVSDLIIDERRRR